MILGLVCDGRCQHTTGLPNSGQQQVSVLIRLQTLHRFVLATIAATLCLVVWGGFVTSINAGLAVPDWPTSFNSWDPLSPFPGWWEQTPILAEHGHRLIGAVVGFLTLILAGLTWKSDNRPGVRGLALMAVVVVIFQGVLGGLRVVLISLDLAIVHAITAQIYFGLLDLAYHGPGSVKDTDAIAEELHPVTGFPFEPDTHFQAGFGHLFGYDAGYYGYMWSKVYGDDMYTTFASVGFEVQGRRYRELILERGGMVDGADLVRDFLGREPDTAAFLEDLGL